MPVTPSAGVNVLADPECNSGRTHWGAKFFTTACGNVLLPQVVEASSGSAWNDVYSQISSVSDGGDRALRVEERSNYPNFNPGEGPQLANDVDFYSKAGEEWTVRFRWKKISAEHNRQRIRPVFMHRPCNGPGGTGFEFEWWFGPYSEIDAQYGTHGYEWTFVLPNRWYDMGLYTDPAVGWTHPVETMFMIELETDTSLSSWGPLGFEPPYPDPLHDPDLHLYEFDLNLFRCEAFWTGNYFAPVPDPAGGPGVACLPDACVEECGEKIGEVFVIDGTYAGCGGCDGPGGPAGWVRCMNTCESCVPANRILRTFNVPPCCCQSGYRDLSVPIPFVFGVQSLTSISDPSGPGGFEAAPAIQVELPGSLGSAIAWQGAAVFDPTSLTDLLWLLKGQISADTGWHPQDGECWTFDCWVKSPDLSGPDARFGFGFSKPGLSYSRIGAIDLSNDWQFYQEVFTWVHGDTGAPGQSPWIYPMLIFTGDDLKNPGLVTDYLFNTPITHTVLFPKGTVLFKCPHLYPCEQTPESHGNRLAHWHGHG